MESEDVPALAEARGYYLRKVLGALPGVSTVRGLGLLVGVELAGGDARGVAARCQERGLVVNAVTSTALRLAPSLLVSEAEIDEAVGILAAVLNEHNDLEEQAP
jgi:acetylornithine/succinyldiaminopimelate/putrescine aminotransferase